MLEKFEKLLEKERDRVAELDEADDDAAVLKLLEDHILEDPEFTYETVDEIYYLINRLFLALRRDLYILDPLVKDESITEIMVNGTDKIFVEQDGMVKEYNERFESQHALMEVIRRIAAGVGREINELNPILDARLEDGSRVNAVYGNVALNGPTLTIRKFPKVSYSMEDLVQMNTISKQCAGFLIAVLTSGYNFFISGGTSSGKTTFLNALAEFLPEDDRIIVIEDSAELKMDGRENCVRLECRNGNSEGKGRIEMSDLIKTSLRMRPDHIIVGEVRGREVVDMINAMNTGHDGSLSTGHGNSIRGMLRRLESMFLTEGGFPMEAVRNQIAEGIDIMVHLGKYDGLGRKVLEVSEIVGVKDGDYVMNKLFEYVPELGLQRTNNSLQNITKLEMSERARFEKSLEDF